MYVNANLSIAIRAPSTGLQTQLKEEKKSDEDNSLALVNANAL